MTAGKMAAQAGHAFLSSWLDASSLSLSAATDYAAHPDRLYLVGKDGKLAWVGEQGPRGFRPNELEAAILVETGRKPAEVASTPSGGRTATTRLCWSVVRARG